jgi:hypothetical protein
VLLALLIVGLIIASVVLGAAWDAPRSPLPPSDHDRSERG